jgi:hypothetical protein
MFQLPAVMHISVQAYNASFGPFDPVNMPGKQNIPRRQRPEIMLNPVPADVQPVMLKIIFNRGGIAACRCGF